jgi:hypothetical protein
MQYAMLVNIWMGVLSSALTGWGYIAAMHTNHVERHSSRAPNEVPVVWKME